MADLTSLANSDPTSAQALTTTDRVMGLQASGYSFLPTQTLFALANSGLSDVQISQQAEALRKTMLSGDQYNALAHQATALNEPKIAKRVSAKADDGLKLFFSDPVLQKAPSAALALKQYLSGAVGQWPVAGGTVAHTQQQLQLRGYAQGLPVDGNWSPDWQNANTQYAHAMYNSQLAGSKPGSTSLGHAMQMLRALMPVSAFDAITGFIFSLPDMARDFLADTAGGVAGSIVASPLGGHSRVPFFSRASPEENRAFGETSAAVKNFFGADTTAGAETRSIRDYGFNHLVEDVNTVLMATSMMGYGSRLATAIGEARVPATLAEAGEAGGVVADTVGPLRGPRTLMQTFNARAALDPVTGEALAAKVDEAGNLIKTQMVANRAGRTAAGIVLGGAGSAAAGGNQNEILGGAALGGLAGFVSATKAFESAPILGRMGPILDSLADQEGLYYKMRNVVAAPYNWELAGIKPVQLAGDVLQHTTVEGATLRGLAAAQGEIAPTETSQNLQNQTTVLDTVNDAIKHRLEFTVLGAHIQPGLDDLQFFLHGGAEVSRTAIGASVDNAKAAFDHALSEPGWGATIQRVTGMSAEDAIKAVRETHPNFTEDQWNRFWADKLYSHAASFEAKNRRNRFLQDAGQPAEEGLGTDRAAFLRDAEHEIINDPDQRAAALRAFAGQGQNQFFTQLHSEIALSGLSPKKYLQRDLGTFMEANDHVRDAILPYVGQMIPDGIHEGQKVLVGASDTPGGMGIARTDSLTKPEALALANQLDQERLDIVARKTAFRQSSAAVSQGNLDLGSLTTPVSIEEENAFTSKLRKTLHQEFGVNADQMPQDDVGKIDKIRDFSELLATPIVANRDAPPELHAAIATLNDMGYQPVSGTDIGWRMVSASPIDMTAGELTTRRKVIEGLGLSPAMVAERDIYSLAADNFMTNLQHKIETDQRLAAEMPPFVQPNTVWAYLQKKGVIDNPTGYLRKVAETVARTPERLAKNEGWKTETGAPDVIRAEQEMNARIAPQSLTMAQIKSAFTPGKLETFLPEAASEQNARAAAFTAAGGQLPTGISDYAAAEILDSIRKAYADLPTRYIGAQKIENLFRQSLGFAGKSLPGRMAAGAIVGATGAYITDPTNPDLGKELVAAGIGGLVAGTGLPGVSQERLGFALANLPKALINARNEFRFDLNPTFDAQRLMKANVKMGVEGIPMTWAPLKAMKQAGTLQYDREALAALRPEAAGHLAEADDATLAAMRQGVWAYNPDNIEAYIAGHLARQGITGDNAADMLVHIMGYGANGVKGRSALERTINFVFFPFSFEKTVYRNLGGYLLDRPAQRIVLTNAMAAYDDFNRNHLDGSNPLATSWWTQHVPLAQDLMSLNMFAHGLSPGEPGGINRPLLNLFLPQSWAASKDSTANLERFIPMVKSLGKIIDDSKQQVHIVEGAVDNMWNDLKGIPGMSAVFGQKAGYTYSSPPASTLTKQAQLDAGFAMQRDMFTKYGALLDYNAKAVADRKLNFPLDASWGDYAGTPITKAAIRSIIHGYYPEFTEEGATLNATTNSAAWAAYTRHLNATDPTLGGEVKTFEDNTSLLTKTMKSNRAPASFTAQYTDALRQMAMRIAEQDATFYSLYKKNFQKLLGPLEAVQ